MRLSPKSQLTPERRSIIEYCMKDGWPKYEVRDTFGIHLGTLARHYPDYPVMPQKDRAEIAAGMRRLNQLMRKRGLTR